MDKKKIKTDEPSDVVDPRTTMDAPGLPGGPLNTEPDQPPDPSEPPKKVAPPAKPGRSLDGVLYSAAPGKIVLAGHTHGVISPGTEHETAESVHVIINGREANGMDDLRRGDKVNLSGEPVSSVVARR